MSTLHLFIYFAGRELVTWTCQAGRQYNYILQGVARQDILGGAEAQLQRQRPTRNGQVPATRRVLAAEKAIHDEDSLVVAHYG